MHIKGEQRLRYNMKARHKKGAFDILQNISEYVTLVKLMDSPINVNRATSIVWYWIFDSNHEKGLCLTKESLDLIFSPYIGKEQVTKFQYIFYAIRFI